MHRTSPIILTETCTTMISTGNDLILIKNTTGIKGE